MEIISSKRKQIISFKSSSYENWKLLYRSLNYITAPNFTYISVFLIDTQILHVNQ